MHGEAARNGGTLLLSAGKVARQEGCPLRQAHLAQVLEGQGFGLLTGNAQHLHGCQHHVFQHGEVGEEVELLEDHPHALAQFVARIIRGKDVVSFNNDAS